MKALVYNPSSEGMETALICDSAISPSRNPFFLPDEGRWKGVHLVGVRIDRLGKSISSKFADRYFSECVTAVHPFTDSPVENNIDRYGRDGALIVSDAVSKERLEPEFHRLINDLIEKVSRNVTLKTGDLVLTPAGPVMSEITDRPSDIDIPSTWGCPPMKLKIR